MSDPISDLKHELLAAAERQQGRAAAGAGRGRGGCLWAGPPTPAAATMAVAAAVALFVSTPWRGRPASSRQRRRQSRPPGRSCT